MHARHVSYMLYIIYNSFSDVGERDRLRKVRPPGGLGDRCRGFPIRSRCRLDRPVFAGVCRKGQYGLAPLRVVGVARVRISVGKLRGLQQISDDTGRFTMIAMDQRGSLQKMLRPENPKAATYAEMEAVKLGVTEALAPHASGYLLDPEYGVAPAINRFALPGRTGR